MNKLFIFVFFTTSFIYALNFDNISFITEDYPPYNFIENNNLTGISVDVLFEIFSKTNQIKNNNIKLIPWARGYNLTLNNKDTCLFSTARTNFREKLFKWVGPIDSIEITSVVAKNSGIVINSFDDLFKYKIGAVIKDVGEQYLLESGINEDSIYGISGENSINRGLKMLQQGRFDIFVYGKKTVLWDIKKMDLDLDAFDFLYTLKTIELYYAFNVETSDVLIEEMQKVLDELKDDETLQKILDKY